MTVIPYYDIGTVSIPLNATVATFAGGTLLLSNAKADDTLIVEGFFPVEIVDIIDDTHASIDEWPGPAVVAGDYKIRQNGLNRYSDPEISADIVRLVEDLDAAGYIIHVGAEETAPNPLSGNEGQVAYQPATDLWWRKQSGLWTPYDRPLFDPNGGITWAAEDSEHGPFSVAAGTGSGGENPHIVIGYNLLPNGELGNADERGLALAFESDYDDGSDHNKMEIYFQYQLPDDSDAPGYSRPFFSQYDKVTDLPIVLYLAGGAPQGIVFGWNDGTGSDQEKVIGKTKAHLLDTAYVVFNQPGSASEAFYIDSSIPDAVTGLLVTTQPATNGVHLSARSSVANDGLYLSGKGSGPLVLQADATGSVLVEAAASFSDSITVANDVGAATFNNVGLASAGSPAGLMLGGGKSVAINNSLSFAGTDGATLTFQGTDTYLGRDTVDTLTHKSVDAGSNTISNLTTANFAANVIDTDGALAANSDTRVPSQAAVVTYLAARIAALDVVELKSGIDCSANPDYPAADAGWFYKVTAAGKIGGASGPKVESGDTLFCIADGSAAGSHATVGANWDIIQVNLDGAVIGPGASTSGNFPSFSGTGGKLIQDSGKAVPGGAVVGTTDTQVLTHKDLTDATNSFPSLNQNTTGSAAKLTTARGIDGQDFDGTAGITVIAPGTHAATDKTTPADADELPVVDSAAAFVLKKLTWANLKATLKAYFDALYAPVVPASSAYSPGVTSGTVGATPATFTLNNARYIRNGKLCTVWANVGISNQGVGNGGSVIIDLPFTATGTHQALGSSEDIGVTGESGRAFVGAGGSTMHCNRYDNATYVVTGKVILAQLTYETA
jgi:hypothetical protein